MYQDWEMNYPEFKILSRKYLQNVMTYVGQISDNQTLQLVLTQSNYI